MGLPYFMVLSEGWIHNGFFQFFQVIGIRVRQCTVKILDQYIQILRMIGSLLHFQVAFPDRLRHSALTHILTDDNIAGINELLNLTQDFPEIDITATKYGYKNGDRPANLFSMRVSAPTLLLPTISILMIKISVILETGLTP